MAFLFNDDMSAVDFDEVIEPIITQLKEDCWGWLEQ